MEISVERSSSTTGKFRELVFLFFPISLITGASSLFILLEKLFLAKYSVLAMEAGVTGTYVWQIFQGPCIALAMMAQVFVGRWKGGVNYNAIGPGIWQFIWFSLLSTIITLPTGAIYGHIYFEGTAIEEIVLPYYYLLLSINFLYPLSTTLSCFYIGQGKTRLVLCVNLGAQLIKLACSYLLIFGWGNWIPSFGLMGAAISSLISQTALCLFLGCCFLSRRNDKTYRTRHWHFQPRLFWECIHPGLLRAGGRVLTFACWASIAYLMTNKGGDYLLILSAGGTLLLFLPFVADAICQALTTVVSHILGAQNYPLLDRAFRSATWLVLLTSLLLSIPFLLFPSFTFHTLFPGIVVDTFVIRNLCLGIWLCFVFYTFDFVPVSYVLAFKDTKFSLFMGVFNWVNGFALMYIAVEKMQMVANQFWLVLSLMHATTALLYYFRMKWLQANASTLNLSVKSH